MATYLIYVTYDAKKKLPVGYNDKADGSGNDLRALSCVGGQSIRWTAGRGVVTIQRIDFTKNLYNPTHPFVGPTPTPAPDADYQFRPKGQFGKKRYCYIVTVAVGGGKQVKDDPQLMFDDGSGASMIMKFWEFVWHN